MTAVDDEEVVVDDEEVVVSLFSFDLLFVAFGSLSFCGDSGVGVAVVVVDVVTLVVVGSCCPSSTSSSSFFFGTGLISAVAAAAAASLNFLHSFRCSPCFQWFIWHSRLQYCTVWHNLQGFNGRNGVLGLPQVEQQRMVGVVRPSCLSNR